MTRNFTLLIILATIAATAVFFARHDYSTLHMSIASPSASKPISDTEAATIIHDRWGTAISLADEQRDPVCNLSDTHSAQRYKSAAKHIHDLSMIALKRFPNNPVLPPIVDPAFSCEGWEKAIKLGDVHSKFNNLADRADKLEQASRAFEDALNGRY